MTGKTILIVDDDSASRIFLSRILQKNHYTVLQAASGKEGLISTWRDHPDLMLVDPVLPDLSSEEFINKLRQDRRTARLPVIALSRDSSPGLKESSIAIGYDGFLVKSSEALSGLTDTLDIQLRKKESPEENGLLIVFLSAKGGTGTSSLCANIATSISKFKPEMNIVVADFVLPISSIAPIVGYEDALNLVTISDLPPEQTTSDYFRENLPVIDNWRFQLLAGAPDPESANSLNVGRIQGIMRVLQSEYDLVLLDLGRSLSRISLPLIQQADLIALVVSTDLSTVTLTKTVWEYLQAQGIGAERLYTLLNRAVGLEGITKAEAEDILGFDIKYAVPYMGGNFSLANNQHQPIIEKFPNDTATMVLRQASSEMAELARKLRLE
ncbi:MAG: response regulator [Anaerolineales bacterium]|nr:response regulator [Anaerolineales bacterium]